MNLDAQVLATALNVYATTQSLGGTAAAAYGFTVDSSSNGRSDKVRTADISTVAKMRTFLLSPDRRREFACVDRATVVAYSHDTATATAREEAVLLRLAALTER